MIQLPNDSKTRARKNFCRLLPREALNRVAQVPAPWRMNREELTTAIVYRWASHKKLLHEQLEKILET